MRICTGVGEFETEGEKSEVQSDLQILSSLVALAPFSFALATMPSLAQLFLPLF